MQGLHWAVIRPSKFCLCSLWTWCPLKSPSLQFSEILWKKRQSSSADRAPELEMLGGKLLIAIPSQYVQTMIVQEYMAALGIWKTGTQSRFLVYPFMDWENICKWQHMKTIRWWLIIFMSLKTANQLFLNFLKNKNCQLWHLTTDIWIIKS